MSLEYNHRLSFTDFPNPPTGYAGWPWVTEYIPSQGLPSDSQFWPRISIITPNYNQGRYLEEAIRSVLLQGYPNLEYYIIDGGSSDESVDIIRKYERWITGWISEEDTGQSNAINKGARLCTGDIVNWLCSDDSFTQGAFFTVARNFMYPSLCDVLAGACFCRYDTNPVDNKIRPSKGKEWKKAPYLDGVWQPSCFWRRSLVKRFNLVDDHLHFCMDRELWCYLQSVAKHWRWTGEVLSVYRYTGCNKSILGRRSIIDEIDVIYKIYYPEIVSLSGLLRNIWLPLVLKSLGQKNIMIKYFYLVLAKISTVMLLLCYNNNRVRDLQREYYMYSIW